MSSSTTSTATPTKPRRWPWPLGMQASVGLHAAAAIGTATIPGAWPWAAGAVLANHALLTGAGLWPRSTLLGPNITRLPGSAAQVAITLDDGPDPELTPAVLDILAAHGARATFFCIAERARAQAALVRRIVSAGHSVQNHSLRHRHHFSLLGPRGLRAEIGAAQALLADLSGVRPIAFRAPAGLRNPLLDPVLHQLGLHLVSWTRRGFDTRSSDAQRVLHRLTGGLAAGDILLLHDGRSPVTRSGQALVLDVLPRLLQHCHAAGLRSVTLADTLTPRGA
jgi:peptidoglycan-N-acetylglucosamine deacetylase